MAIQGFPFTDSGGDREYGAADFAGYEDVLMGGKSGVVSGLLNELACTSLGAYQTSINTGGAVFSGYAFRNTSAITQTHTSVASGSKRYDLVVIRLDTATTRQFSATIVYGTATTGTATVPSAGANDTVLGRLYIDNSSGTPSFTMVDQRAYLGLHVSNTYFLNLIKAVDGAGSGIISEGIQTTQMTDLDVDPATLSLAVGETRVYYGVSPSGDVFGGSAFDLTITRATSTVWNASASAGAFGQIWRRRYSSGAWGQWIAFNSYRTYSGGTVSGTVTLPSIEINETMDAWYTIGASTANFTLPATGTYNVSYIGGVSGACQNKVTQSGGTMVFGLGTSILSARLTYTRTA